MSGQNSGADAPADESDNKRNADGIHPARTARQMFNKKNVGTLRKMIPDAENKDLLDRLKMMWEALSPEEIARHEGYAQDDADRFERETEELKEKSKEEQKPEKVKKAKKEKEDNGIKGKISAYIYFCNSRRETKLEELKDELGKDAVNLTRTLMARLGAEWKELSEEDKEPFQQQATDDKERYDREIEAAGGKPAKAPKAKKEPKEKKEKAGPKKSKSAYLFFCEAKREETVATLKEEHGDEFEQTLVMEAMGKGWRELTDEEKEPYEEQAAEDKKRYNEEVEKAGGKPPKEPRAPKEPRVPKVKVAYDPLKHEPLFEVGYKFQKEFDDEMFDGQVGALACTETQATYWVVYADGDHEELVPRALARETAGGSGVSVDVLAKAKGEWETATREKEAKEAELEKKRAAQKAKAEADAKESAKLATEAAERRSQTVA